jgi:hypothetical protein
VVLTAVAQIKRNKFSFAKAFLRFRGEKKTRQNRKFQPQVAVHRPFCLFTLKFLIELKCSSFQFLIREKIHKPLIRRFIISMLENLFF